MSCEWRFQKIQERLAIVVVAQQVVDVAPRMVGRQPLEPMKGGLDRVFQGRQGGPAKIENIAAQHQHRRPLHRLANGFGIARGVGPPGEKVQIGDETDAVDHALSIADWPPGGKGQALECGGLPPLFKTASITTGSTFRGARRLLESGGRPPHSKAASYSGS